MPRKPAPKPSEPHNQMELDFDTVISTAQVLSREDVARTSRMGEGSQDYDPVGQTTEYMRRAVRIEEEWETTIQEARRQLLTIDAREIYFNFLADIKRRVDGNVPNCANLAKLLETVAIRGLGMSRDHIRIETPLKGGTQWRITLKEEAIRRHLDTHIIGQYFLNRIEIHDTVWQTRQPIIAASDVSQHRSAVPVPARFFKRSVPFVLNNAAGTLFRVQDGKAKYDNVFNPKPDDTLLRWMLIDPSYQDELEPEDYERCIASAMDVGQYKFDLEYLLKANKRSPDIIFRDGSLFPQDAYLDNFVIESKRGDFTREAIRELLACLSYAREVGVVYCGVSKSVQLKVYSAIVDWFIATYIDKNWEIGNYTLNDGQAMSLLLSSPSFVGTNLQQALTTCLIRRSFTTRANLNTRADLNNLDATFRRYQEQNEEIDITPFRRLCEIAHVYMFFIGHSKSPQQQLPRYEFFYTDSFGPISEVAQKILSALQHCGLMNDNDHSFMADKPITYLIPSVTQQAHLLSKDVGKYIDTATGQWIMARYRSFLK
jgi:NurA domain